VGILICLRKLRKFAIEIVITRRIHNSDRKEARKHTIGSCIHDDEARVDGRGMSIVCVVDSIRVASQSIRSFVNVDVVVSSVESP
jgi:hypothetical protein